MKAASIAEIKKELQTRPPKALLDICLRLAKFNKDNKELITYLLFEMGNETDYVKAVQAQIDEDLGALYYRSHYNTMKAIQKVLRRVNKYIKYSGNKQTEAELLIHFCKTLNKHGYFKSTKLYQRQVQKISTAIAKLHEDLQYDFAEDVKRLEGL